MAKHYNVKLVFKLGYIVRTVKMPDFLKKFLPYLLEEIRLSDQTKILCLFVSNFFALGFTPHSVIFDSYGIVTIISEGRQILTDTRHPWSLSSESSIFNVPNLLYYGTTVYMII